jgi:hypothetical protein
MKKVFALLLFTACGAYVPAPAVAQTSADSGLLWSGITTSPEISRRCQEYTNRRVSRGGEGDRMRQGVFLACVQKLSQGGGAAAAAAGAAAATPPPPALTSAPVAATGPAYVTAPVYAPGPEYIESPVGLYGPWGFGYGCVTDEGYGRLGVCGGPHQ